MRRLVRHRLLSVFLVASLCLQGGGNSVLSAMTDPSRPAIACNPTPFNHEALAAAAIGCLIPLIPAAKISVGHWVHPLLVFTLVAAIHAMTQTEGPTKEKPYWTRAALQPIRNDAVRFWLRGSFEYAIVANVEGNYLKLNNGHAYDWTKLKDLDYFSGDPLEYLESFVDVVITDDLADELFLIAQILVASVKKLPENGAQRIQSFLDKKPDLPIDVRIKLSRAKTKLQEQFGQTDDRHPEPPALPDPALVKQQEEQARADILREILVEIERRQVAFRQIELAHAERINQLIAAIEAIRSQFREMRLAAHQIALDAADSRLRILEDQVSVLFSSELEAALQAARRERQLAAERLAEDAARHHAFLAEIALLVEQFLAIRFTTEGADYVIAAFQLKSLADRLKKYEFPPASLVEALANAQLEQQNAHARLKVDEQIQESLKSRTAMRKANTRMTQDADLQKKLKVLLTGFENLSGADKEDWIELSQQLDHLVSNAPALLSPEVKTLRVDIHQALAAAYRRITLAELAGLAEQFQDVKFAAQLPIYTTAFSQFRDIDDRVTMSHETIELNLQQALQHARDEMRRAKARMENDEGRQAEFRAIATGFSKLSGYGDDHQTWLVLSERLDKLEAMTAELSLEAVVLQTAANEAREAARQRIEALSKTLVESIPDELTALREQFATLRFANHRGAFVAAAAQLADIETRAQASERADLQSNIETARRDMRDANARITASERFHLDAAHSAFQRARKGTRAPERAVKSAQPGKRRMTLVSHPDQEVKEAVRAALNRVVNRDNTGIRLSVLLHELNTMLEEFYGANPAYVLFNMNDLIYFRRDLNRLAGPVTRTRKTVFSHSAYSAQAEEMIRNPANQELTAKAMAQLINETIKVDASSLVSPLDHNDVWHYRDSNHIPQIQPRKIKTILIRRNVQGHLKALRGLQAATIVCAVNTEFYEHIRGSFAAAAMANVSDYLRRYNVPIKDHYDSKDIHALLGLLPLDAEQVERTANFIRYLPFWATEISAIREAILSVSGENEFLANLVQEILAPIILQQPIDVTVLAGSPKPIRFKVEASGALPITYEWWMKRLSDPDFILAAGTASAVERDFFPLLDDESDGTTYRCVISNSFGAISTTDISLRILPRPEKMKVVAPRKPKPAPRPAPRGVSLLQHPDEVVRKQVYALLEEKFNVALGAMPTFKAISDALNEAFKEFLAGAVKPFNERMIARLYKAREKSGQTVAHVRRVLVFSDSTREQQILEFMSRPHYRTWFDQPMADELNREFPPIAPYSAANGKDVGSYRKKKGLFQTEQKIRPRRGNSKEEQELTATS